MMERVVAVSKADDGTYQVMTEDGVDTNIGRFINDDNGSRAKQQAIADMLDVLVDTDEHKWNWGQCESSWGRANAMDHLNRIFNELPYWSANKHSINDFFRLPDEAFAVMDRLVSIMRKNLSSIHDDNDWSKYEQHMKHIVFRFCFLASARTTASVTVDGMMAFLILNENDCYSDAMDMRRRLENIGIGLRIDPPEDLLSADVVLDLLGMMSVSSFNPYFALATRPDDVGLHEAITTLQGMAKKTKDFLPGTMYRKWRNMATWDVLTHEWENWNKELVQYDFLDHDDECAHALVLALEDRGISSDKVDRILDLFLRDREDDPEFDDIRRGMIAKYSSDGHFDVNGTQSMVLDKALEYGDVDLLKAWEWLKVLFLKLLIRDYGEFHDWSSHLAYDLQYRMDVSRSFILNALEHYDNDMPWSFILECPNGVGDSEPTTVRLSLTVRDQDDYDCGSFDTNYEVRFHE